MRNSDDQLSGVFAMGKLHKSLKTFESKHRELQDIDYHLLKGFYVSNKIELEHEEDKEANKEFNINHAHDFDKAQKMLSNYDK